MKLTEMDFGAAHLHGLMSYGGSTYQVDVDLTFTAMGCPAYDFLLSDVRERLLREPGVEDVLIRVVWDPPWSAERLTEAGRDALQMWGLAV